MKLFYSQPAQLFGLRPTAVTHGIIAIMTNPYSGLAAYFKDAKYQRRMY